MTGVAAAAKRKQGGEPTTELALSAQALTQRDFLDRVCASSTDPCTAYWRCGFPQGDEANE